MSRADPSLPPVTAFVRSHALRFIGAHRGLIAWFIVTSTVRVGTTVASVVLIRDFLGSILSAPSGIGARSQRLRVPRMHCCWWRPSCSWCS